MIDYKFFVDMDGVLSNFDKSVYRSFAPEYHKWDDYDENKSALDQLDVSKSQMWKRIYKMGKTFWANMEPYPWAEELIKELKNHGNVCILSSPSHDPSSVSGKLEWLQKFFDNRNYNDYIFTSKKYIVSRAGRALIDDREKHIKPWNEEGGLGILFPRPWNDGKNSPHDPVRAVFNTLMKNKYI